ncbi:MAG: VanW family protein [Lachnospiraceae bacterium]|nr:VanW family protein [Lachnospiraceae bacterium]
MRKTGNHSIIRRISRMGAVAAAAMLLLSLQGCGKGEESPVDNGPETAQEGVWINNHNVAGLTLEEIQAVIDQDIVARSQEKIFLNANGMSVTVAAGELGLYCTDPSLAQKALEFGKSGSAVQQFKDHEYIRKNGAYVIDIPYAVNEEIVRAVINDKTPALSEGSGGSVLVHNQDGSFTVIPGENGVTVDEDPSVAILTNYMNQEWTGGVGSTNLAVKEGDISDEVAALELVQSPLGSFSTTYDTSEKERSTNIEVGTAKISGLLLYPGQSASVCNMLEPFTEEEGYAAAHAYEQGLIVDSIGGGVCQISSTLYNALLRAELQIDERCPHSMIVGYIAPSLDAAIAENTKDLIFTNNTDAPILIEGYAGGGTVSFTVYGHETRDPARTLEFESVILEQEDYTYKYELDYTEEAGTFEATEPRNGLKAEGYKCVYINGELQSRELLSRTEYRMSPMILTIGIMGATDSEVQDLSAAIAKDDYDEVIAAFGRVSYNHPGAMTKKEKKEKEEKENKAAEEAAVAEGE